MGAAQSIVLSSEGAAAATTLVIAGAVGYRISKMTKPQEDIEEKGKERAEEEKQTPGGSRESPDASKARKKKSKKGAASTQAADTGISEAGTLTAQVVPGGFDVAVTTTAATKDTSKSKSKGKTKQALASSGRAGTTAQNGDDGDDDASSATPSEAPPPPVASASGSKSRKSKKRKKPTPGASSSASILTLANASSSKATLSASNLGIVESSAATAPGTADAAARAEETNPFAPHGSKPKKRLHSGDASTTEDNEDDGKPFLASLSSSRQQTMGQSRMQLIPPMTTPSSVYPDTDSSWTHIRRTHNRRDNNSSSGLGQLSTSDAGVVSSVTDDGYPSSPMAERAEDTEEDEAGEQTQGLGLGSSYVRASGDNTQRKTLAERLLPKPRKTGVEDMLETPDHPTLSRVVRVRPLPGEKPVSGFSWADYEEVHVDEGAGHDADGEDDGWGVVRSRRSRPDHSSSAGATPSADASATARTAPGKSGASTKKQRQNAKKREATKATKAEAEEQRLAALAQHKQQLERERMIEQLSKGRNKAPSGGMNASVDDNGKLVWE